jgi:uncharacterized protein (DUF952 family)
VRGPCYCLTQTFRAIQATLSAARGVATRGRNSSPLVRYAALELQAWRRYVQHRLRKRRKSHKRLNDKQETARLRTIYKICPASAWREAERQGVFRGSADDVRDGFIHFSTAAQVRETARKHFFGQTGLFLIAVDADALGDALRFEPSRNGELFPHLYGELDLGAVTAILDLRARSDGYPEVPALVQ